MYKHFIFLFAVGFFSNLMAQSTAPKGKLYVLNEGTFANGGSVGVADFWDNTYQELTSVSAFGNQIVFAHNRLFVTDGDGNVKTMTLQGVLIDSAMNIGARSVAFFNDDIVIACNKAPYVKVYDKANFAQPKYVIDTIQIRTSREEMVILGDRAFISGFYGDSAVYRLNLITQDVRRIETATNPYQIELCAGRLQVGCFAYNPDFTTNTTIVTIDPDFETVIHSHLMEKASGFTASDNFIYQQSDVTGNLLYYNPVTHVVDSVALGLFAYVQHYDRATNEFFFSTTDFSTYGKVNYLKDLAASGTAIDSDISPRGFCFIPDTSNTAINASNQLLLRTYPNPTRSHLWVNVPNSSAPITAKLTDVSGKVCYTQTNIQSEWVISLADLPAGIYFLAITDGKSSAWQKVIKN